MLAVLENLIQDYAAQLVWATRIAVLHRELISRSIIAGARFTFKPDPLFYSLCLRVPGFFEHVIKQDRINDALESARLEPCGDPACSCNSVVWRLLRTNI